MTALVNAATDFVAAVLAKLGVMGRPRRRASIRDDLDLLERLRGMPEFGESSTASKFMTDYIANEIATYAGVSEQNRGAR